MTLTDFISHNQIFSTVVVGGVGGYLLTLGRKIPEQIFEILQRKMTSSITVTNDDEFYRMFQNWLATEKYSQKAKNLFVSTNRMESSVPQIVFTPAPGEHLFKWRGTLVWMKRDRKDPAAGGTNNSTIVAAKVSETTVFRVMKQDAKILRDLCEEIKAMWLAQHETDATLNIYISRSSYWEPAAKKSPRPLDSVLLPKGELESISDDLQRFIDSQDKYFERGIPYRRGYLMFGEKGAGKTSLVSALSAHFKRDLYVLSLSDPRLSDSDLLELFSTVNQRNIVLIEDIDCIFTEREKSADSRGLGVTFSGLLNALDGVATREGLVTFISTNHIEKLDPALIRPGRCDMQIEFFKADEYQLENLFKRFFNDGATHKVFAAKYAGNITMAEAQEILIRSNTPEETLNYRA